MSLMRHGINPNKEFMEAMHQGVVSANQAAQAAAQSAAHHHQMAATSANLFTLSIHQAEEALQMAASSSGRPPPPPPPQTAAQRTNEYVLPQAPDLELQIPTPEPPPTIDSGMSNMSATKRVTSQDAIREVEQRQVKAMRTAVRAASRGAQRDAAANNAPATKQDEQPAASGYQP